jgi:Zn-dependent protease
MFDTGYLTLLKLGRRRVPVRIHWTAPIAAWLMTGRGLYPVRWLTFLVLILCHELGHAFMVRLARAHVLSIDLTAIGGQCSWSGHASRYQRAYIASGGVLAQALLFVAAQLVFAFRLRPFGVHTFAVLDVLTEANLVIAGLNLLPVKPLDGAEAWSVIPLSLKRLRLTWLDLRMRSLERARDRRRSADDDSRWLN